MSKRISIARVSGKGAAAGVAAAAVVAIAMASLACSTGEPPAAVPGAVAWVDGQAVTRDDLELYLRVNLVELPDGSAAEADADRVRSRLLDALVEEQALAAEARKRGVQVGEEEIDAHLSRLRAEESGSGALPAADRRRLVGQRLLIRKLLESAASELPPATDEEVQAFLESRRDEYGSRRRVILRTLMFESVEQAEKIHDDIRRGRTSFAKSALEHEKQPGQAAPSPVAWGTLPETVQDALAELKAGEVSRAVDHHGQVYLFQVQAWLNDPGETEQDLLHAARRELELHRRRQADGVLRRELLKNSEIRLETESLPFRYVPAEG